MRAYWGTDEQHINGYYPVLWPGVLHELLCCASDGCNRPGAPPPREGCYVTASVPTGGYCLGRTFVYRVCSTDQEQADLAAGYATRVPPRSLPAPSSSPVP